MDWLLMPQIRYNYVYENVYVPSIMSVEEKLRLTSQLIYYYIVIIMGYYTASQA